MRTLIATTLVALAALIVMLVPTRHSEVAVYGRTLRPCPPACVVINKRTSLSGEGEFVKSGHNPLAPCPPFCPAKVQLMHKYPVL